MRHLIYFLTLTQLLLINSVNGNAEIVGKDYINKYVGLTFTIPEGWSIKSESQINNLFPGVEESMNIDAPVEQETSSQILGKILLWVSYGPFYSDTQTESIIMIAINVRNLKDSVTSGADYINYSMEGFRQSMPITKISGIETISLGGMDFSGYRARVTMREDIYLAQLAIVKNDYIIALNISSKSESGLEKLIQYLNHNLQLSSVTSEVDDSAEGKSFRKQTTLNVSNSSPYFMTEHSGKIATVLCLVFILILSIKGPKEALLGPDKFVTWLVLICTLIFIFIYFVSK
jgi:hypothetical protein